MSSGVICRESAINDGLRKGRDRLLFWVSHLLLETSIPLPYIAIYLRLLSISLDPTSTLSHQFVFSIKFYIN